MTIDVSSYDFLDFGASRGGSIDFAQARLGGDRGLGIDIDPRKVAEMQNLDLDCIQCDVTRLDMPTGAVRFVVMSHFLEHLPDSTTVWKVLASAAQVATDFLFIQGPYFDADSYLHSLGLKFNFSDWRGHTHHLQIPELGAHLENLGLTSHEFRVRLPLTDSSHPAIHTLDTPPDQLDYDPAVHPAKPRLTFTEPVFFEMVCYVQLRPLDNWTDIIQARKLSQPLPGVTPPTTT